MNIVFEIIQAIESLLDLSDRINRKKRGKERLRVAFHIAVDPETLKPIPEILVVNEGDRPQNVEYIFAETGMIFRKKIPLFVKWGARELPQVSNKDDTLVIRLADHGTIEDAARDDHIRVGVITDFGDTFVSDWISHWKKIELRRAVGLDDHS